MTVIINNPNMCIRIFKGYYVKPFLLGQLKLLSSLWFIIIVKYEKNVPDTWFLLLFECTSLIGSEVIIFFVGVMRDEYGAMQRSCIFQLQILIENCSIHNGVLRMQFSTVQFTLEPLFFTNNVSSLSGFDSFSPVHVQTLNYWTSLMDGLPVVGSNLSGLVQVQQLWLCWIWKAYNWCETFSSWTLSFSFLFSES